MPGATGYLDTDYAAKGRYAVEALKEHDLVCVHVEAPDEALHEGRADAKIEALEQIDRHIVAPVFAALQGYPQWRILVSPDHPTPIRTKTHSHGDVPMAMAGSGIAARWFRPLRRSHGRAIEPRVSGRLAGDGIFYRRRAPVTELAPLAEEKLL